MGREMNEKINELFKEQIDGGATDQFFYVIENKGEVKIERHRGTLDTLSTNNLEFVRMSKSTPVFRKLELANE
jgi:hypothetical protein